MEENQWGPWVKIVKQSGVWKILEETPQKYKRVVAAALSVAKWYPKRNFSIAKATCGWCAWSFFQRRIGFCKSCPVAFKDMGCYDPKSLFCQAIRKNKYTPMYSLLVNIYREEYEKVFKKGTHK